MMIRVEGEVLGGGAAPPALGTLEARSGPGDTEDDEEERDAQRGERGERADDDEEPAESEAGGVALGVEFAVAAVGAGFGCGSGHVVAV